MNPNFYRDHYIRVRQATFALLCHGVRFDVEGAKQKAVELNARKEQVKNELDGLTNGYPLYSVARHKSDKLNQLLAEKRRLVDEKNAIPKSSKSERKAKLAECKEAALLLRQCRDDGSSVEVERGVGLSDQRIIFYLYTTLKCPPHKKKNKQTGKISLTADDVALKKTAMNRPELQQLTELILEHRKCNKLLGYLAEGIVDPDGRMRSFYKPFGTQTGRLSSSSNPLDTGTNAQNFDRSLKYLLIPDAG